MAEFEALAQRVHTMPISATSATTAAFTAPFPLEITGVSAVNGGVLAIDGSKHITALLRKYPIKSDGTADTLVTVGTVGGALVAWAAGVPQVGALTAANVKLNTGDSLVWVTTNTTHTWTTPSVSFTYVPGARS